MKNHFREIASVDLDDLSTARSQIGRLTKEVQKAERAGWIRLRFEVDADVDVHCGKTTLTLRLVGVAKGE
jgi:hypothetical protein